MGLRKLTNVEDNGPENDIADEATADVKSEAAAVAASPETSSDQNDISEDEDDLAKQLEALGEEVQSLDQASDNDATPTPAAQMKAGNDDAKPDAAPEPLEMSSTDGEPSLRDQVAGEERSSTSEEEREDALRAARDAAMASQERRVAPSGGGSYPAGPLTYMFAQLKKAREARRAQGNTPFKNKYFAMREARVDKKMMELSLATPKVAKAVEAYNASLLSHDKMQILKSAADQKGVSLGDYIKNVRKNPGTDPTGAMIVDQVMSDPAIVAKSAAMHRALDTVHQLNGELGTDMRDLSDNLGFSANPDRLKNNLEFYSAQQGKLGESLASETPAPIAEAKTAANGDAGMDGGFEKRMKELAESMREMAARIAEKIASLFGAGPKAG